MRRLARDLKNAPVSGRDMLHGIYLPFCDIFVSEDHDQQVLARIVAESLRNRRRVIRVADICDV